MDTFSMKKGDTPLMTMAFYGPGTSVPDFTTASSILLRLRNAKALSGADKVATTNLTVLSPTNSLSYQFLTADTDTAGTYYGEVVATFGGHQTTFPNGGLGTGHFIVQIYDSLRP